MQITELLGRRTDLSTFLVHLTRDNGRRSAKQNLFNIIETNTLEARTPFGAAVDPLNAANLSTDSQRCVCFTETPLEHVSLLAKEIDGRDIEFKPYGVAITRKQGRIGGANPVWYLDMSPSGRDWLTHSTKKLVQAAIGTRAFEEQPIARLAPYMDWMGVWPSGRKKEFWWEREWRYVGNFTLPIRYIVLCPQEERKRPGITPSLE